MGRASMAKEPTAEGLLFQRLAFGIKTNALAKIMGVSREMIRRYRLSGAPEERLELLRKFLARQASEAGRQIFLPGDSNSGWQNENQSV